MHHLSDLGGPGFQKRSFELDDPSSPSPPMLSPQDRADAVAAGLAEYVSEFSSQEIATGPLDTRITNDVYGLGLIDAVTEITMSNLADPEDSDGSGVSGQMHFVLDREGALVAGKFGHKAEVAHLDDVNEEAMLNEHGATSPNIPDEGVVITGKVLNPDDGSISYTTLPLENLISGDVHGLELTPEEV